MWDQQVIIDNRPGATGIIGRTVIDRARNTSTPDKHVRNVLLLCAVSACSVITAPRALAQSTLQGSGQTWPARPIRLVVGYTPGGGTDVISRVLAKYLSETLK